MSNDGNVTRKDGPFAVVPDVNQINDNIVEVRILRGNDLYSINAYYNVETEKFFDIIKCYGDSFENLVAYVNEGRVIVRDIFDVNNYYKEFSSFELPFDPLAKSIKAVNFAKDGKSIPVLYSVKNTGENTSEIIELN